MDARLESEIKNAIEKDGGTCAFLYDEETRTWCLAGETADHLGWETDDQPAESREQAEADAADYLRGVAESEKYDGFVITE